ncbi:MAG TPA: MlaD family protein [Opitutaceae bacterium]|nr:MlaD family protein [Opitutaceae bacterium]
MTEPATPRISRRLSLPLIWVVPLVALAIAAWMLARQFRNHGPVVTIDFTNGAGIEAGKTELEYKGVAVGSVKSVALKPDLGGVTVEVQLTKTASSLARTGSEFWVVHPEVSLAGVRGLETILSGVVLNVRPGDGPEATHFRGLDRPPAEEDTAAGRAYILRTAEVGGLRPGAPVYYRGIKVGAVETMRLAKDASGDLVRIRVYTPYIALVRDNTVFWNAGGVSFHLSLIGAELKATSIESLLEGGISLATPDKGGLAPVARDGAEFELQARMDKDWLKWQPHIPIQPVDTTPEAPKAGAAGVPDVIAK